jgi:hypothetical protein
LKTSLRNTEFADPLAGFDTTKIDVEQESKRSYQRFNLDDLINFRPADDPDCLIGNRWMGRGGTVVFTGEPGHGKSSLALYFLSKWALGLPAFGIEPDRPLKCVIVQAENDEGDMAEPIQGQVDHKSLDPSEQKLLKENLIILQDYESTGKQFAETLENIIEDFKPDVVVADPLMTYAGCDLSRQNEVAAFLYNTLNPIIKKSGIIFGFVHHDRKPSQDEDKKKNSRAMHNSFGSVVISAWAREMVSLVCADEKNKQFELQFGKRGKRTGVGDVIRIRHTKQEGIIRWEQMGVMEGTAPGPSKVAKHETMKADVLKFLEETIPDERGCVRKADVERFAVDKGHNKKDAWNEAQAISRSQTGFHWVHVMAGTYVISRDPNFKLVNPDADRNKVLGYVKSNVLVTRTMLERKWTDPAAPPRAKRVPLMESLVDGETVFYDPELQIHPNKTSQAWSYGKAPGDCSEQIAKLNGSKPPTGENLPDSDPFIDDEKTQNL